MGALFSQKRWFKSRKDYDRDEDKRKNRIQAWTRITLVLIVKIYLQFLFTIGAFIPRRSWVDNHIKMCYNRLDSLKSSYDYATRKQWYK